MLFDDIFYPGNPERREKVRVLSLDLNNSITDYKTAWNNLAAQANPVFSSTKGLDIFFDALTYDVNQNTVSECMQEINKVTDAAKKQASAIIDSIDVGHLPEDWDGTLDHDPEKLHKIMQWLSGVISAGVGGAAAFGVFKFIELLRVFGPLLNVAGRFITSSIGALIAEGIAGAVGFIITDAVISAITGAIERKKLNTAIEALEEAKKDFSEPLKKAALNINSVALHFKDGMVKIDDDNMIIRQKDGTWKVLEIT